MKKTDKIEILASLGYRLIGKDVYAKPFAFNLLTYNLETDCIENLAKALGGQLLLFESEKFTAESDDFTRFIKHFEKHAHMIDNQSNFGFMTMEERINCVLETKC